MICPRSNNQPAFFCMIKGRASKLPNVIFKDFVPFGEINSYFKQAKIYVLTSRYEGFPNTFIQAAMNKTPILSFNVNPDGIIEKYDCGFFARNNLNNLEYGLKEMLINDKERERFGLNAYKYATENHDIKTIINRYSNIFREML